MSLTSRRISNGFVNINMVEDQALRGEKVGGISVGTVVHVIRGVKVPLGTVGTVSRSWGDEYGSLTIRNSVGRSFRTYERNVGI